MTVSRVFLVFVAIDWDALGLLGTDLDSSLPALYVSVV